MSVSPVALLAFSLVGLALHVIDTPIAVRFAFAPANYWFVATAVLLLPISLGWLALRIRAKALRVSAVAGAVLVGLPSLTYAALALSYASSMQGGIDSSFQPLSEARANGTSYRLYLTNCGATCTYGLVLRREHDFLAVRFVSEVWEAYREEPATLRVSASGLVEVHRGEYVLASVKP